MDLAPIAALEFSAFDFLAAEAVIHWRNPGWDEDINVAYISTLHLPRFV